MHFCHHVIWIGTDPECIEQINSCHCINSFPISVAHTFGIVQRLFISPKIKFGLICSVWLSGCPYKFLALISCNVLSHGTCLFSSQQLTYLEMYKHSSFPWSSIREITSSSDMYNFSSLYWFFHLLCSGIWVAVLINLLIAFFCNVSSYCFLLLFNLLGTLDCIF